MKNEIDYKATESDINAAVNDFIRFCRFIDERKTVLSKRKEVLGKNDLFEINALLNFRKEVYAPNYQQESYPVIDLMFNLVLQGKLYKKAADAKGNVYLTSTIRKTEFDGLNSFEKYGFLFETFWTNFDFMELLRWRDDPIHEIVQTFAESRPGQELIKGSFSRFINYDPAFSYLSVIIHYFSYFGFCTYIPVVEENKKPAKYDDSIKVVIPTEFGVNISKILTGQRITAWNIVWMETYGTNEKKSGAMPLFKYLKPVFPDGALSGTVKAEIKKKKLLKSSYTFRVSLERDIWREIRLSFKHTLHDLHLAIQEAFDFDNDHLYSFFMDGKKYSRNAYQSPHCDEGPYADEAILGELELYEKKKILYLFDYGDSWEFTVKLRKMNEEEPLPKEPEIIGAKGDAPLQYGYYDDFDEKDE